MAIEKLPQDPIMLLSFLNTRMRDEKLTLEELCKQFQVSQTEIEDKLDKVGYTYNNELGKFV
ncbi:MAG: DUF4250 domain-containing protein [Lachnospiraceae bacterium]|nr:DUF4250 domain-containing protein [Lachnospiraceae bacterium]